MSIEAFKKWWKETYHDVPSSIWDNEHLHNLAIHSWQACESEQSKSIAELQAQNAELQAQNAELVWALEHVKPATRNIDANAWDVIEKALAKKGE